MTFAKFVFKVIDIAFKSQQNPRKLHKQYCEGVQCTKDIVYDERYPKMKLDTYFVPKADGSAYPVIFEIHGGGFSAGDKKYRKVLCEYFARETGAFVVNVNYGLGQKYVFPEPAKHLVAAFNWVVANAEKYNLDLNKILVTGDSAGGYYSAYLCAVQDSQELQQLVGAMNGRISAAIFNCGIYDTMSALKQKVLFNLTNGVCIDFAGISTKEIDSYEYLKYLSPADYVTANFPKCLIVYAEQDFFCGGQHDCLMAKLDECGVYYDKYGSTLYNDNHTFSLTWKSAAAQEANDKIINFMRDFFADKI
jgi:acetyl esterase/lipase